MSKFYTPDPKPSGDDLQRTDWQDPETQPTIAGDYEAQTAGGHIFKRKYDGAHWRNAITGLISTVQLPWRGIVPGTLPPYKFTHAEVRADVQRDVAMQVA